MKRREPDDIISFSDQYAFLSNVYPVKVRYGRLTFASVEIAYQAAKTTSLEFRKALAALPSNEWREAKKLGRRCIRRSGWEEGKKFKIMRKLIKRKFSNAKFAAKLVRTWDKELVEGNWWHDNTFGECVCPKCKDKEKLNMLGKLLMERRTILQKKLKQYKRS